MNQNPQNNNDELIESIEGDLALLENSAQNLINLVRLVKEDAGSLETISKISKEVEEMEKIKNKISNIPETN